MKSIWNILRKRCLKTVDVRGSHTHCVNDKEFHAKEECKVKSFDDVPGPKQIPLLGNLWRYLPLVGEYSFNNLFKTYEKMYREFGPLVKEQIIGNDVIVHVFDPDDMAKIYVEGGKYPMRRSHTALAKYRRERPHVYKSAGLFPSNGEEWYRFRQMFRPILLNGNTAESLVGVLEGVTDDLVARIRSISDANMEVDLLPELFRWALECIGAITLNRRLGCLSSEGNEEANILVNAAHETHRAVYYTEIFQFLQSFNTPIYRRLVTAQDALSSIVDKYMKEAIFNEEKLKTNYLLSRIVRETKAEYAEIFTMVLDMFLAGIDTSAYTTGFALYNLTKNPSVQEKLREELMHHLPENTTKMTGKLSSLSYLTCVYNESLRLNPVAIGNGRVLTSDTILSGYKIPSNTHIILQHQVAARLEKNFHQANCFMPERWANPKKMTSTQRVASTPFGLDSRSCMGKMFARREMFLAIGKLVRNFKIEYHYEDIGFNTQLINVPDKPFKFRFIPLEK